MDNKKEEQFQIRAYGFGELAQMYLPDIKPKSASVRLSSWIELNVPLKLKLNDIGFKKGVKLLTPNMVKLIADYLGNPS